MATILDFTTVEIDPGLLERVPLGLCQYHQVLPLAREDGCVSAAMVYPHNTAAREMLAELLDAEIVPVQTSAALLQETFDRLSILFSEAPSPEPPRLLLYAPDVDDDALLSRLARTLAREEASECTRFDSSDVGAAAVLTAAGATRCRLCLLPLPERSEWGDVVLRSATSLLMAGTDRLCLQRVLVILRGHGADMRALPWAAAVASAESAGLALLVLSETHCYDLHMLLDHETGAGRHLAAAIKLATAKGVEPTLRIRQGEAIRQIVDEVATRRYDMVVIGAESRGEFAAAVLRKLAALAVDLRALLICKPNRIVTPPKAVHTTKRRLRRE
jgi:nucleotide-binding universal stress UspA family protein